MKKTLIFCIVIIILISTISLNTFPTHQAPSEQIIFLTRSKTQDIVELNLEEYIKGVVYAEMPASFTAESLKSQAVAARTYTNYKLNQKINLCDDPKHCQAWKEPDNSEEYKKVSEAVDLTKNEILTYLGETIQAFFHSSSGGKTESSENVWGKSIPYLISVNSPNEEKIMSSFNSVKEITYKDLKEKINTYNGKKEVTTENLKNKIKILSKTESGRIEKIKIDNATLTGSEIRAILDLRSTIFDIKLNKSSIVFNVKGYGHGIGMSQWGAEVMARDGKTYKEILNYYYPGTLLEKV